MTQSSIGVPRERAKWPKTVGIISIAWAGLGLMCGFCGVGWMMFVGKFLAGAEQQFGPAPDVVKPNSAQLIVGVVGMVAPILLLIAGIATLRRKPAGRVLHLTYALVAIILGAAGAALGIRQQMAIMHWAGENQNDKWVTQGGVGSPFGLIILAAVLLMTFAWPLFCMIWFGAVKRDTKDLDGGLVEETAQHR